MIHQQKKKRHHFVWRKYLRAWANNEQIFCLLNGRIFETSLMNIGQEKYFYRLRELSQEEVAFLQQFIQQSQPPMLQRLNAGWIQTFQQVFQIKKAIEEAGINSPSLNELLEAAICNLEEEFQSKIEDEGSRFLDQLYNRDLGFLDDEDSLISFLYYLCLQYFRTQRMASNIKEVFGGLCGFDISRMWAVLRHIFTTNVSWTLYADRDSFHGCLLQNDTHIPFITGDQPVINTFAVGTNLDEQTEDLEFFYPLSPRLGFLLTRNQERKSFRPLSISSAEVMKLNYGIADQSGEQLYASEAEVLDSIFDSQ